MNLRLIVIQLIYRAVFAAGILAILWVGGQFVYAKTYELYWMSRLRAQPTLANSVAGRGLPSSPPLRSGDLMGRLDIVERKISVVVLEGVENDTLGIAAGLAPESSLPGSDGNLVIAAHRDTFFRELRNIEVGDTIQLSTSRGTFNYLVTDNEFVNRGAAPKRFIVHAHPQTEQ